MRRVFTVLYHSLQWELAVEAGYVTAYIYSDGMALMMYHKGRQ